MPAAKRENQPESRPSRGGRLPIYNPQEFDAERLAAVFLSRRDDGEPTELEELERRSSAGKHTLIVGQRGMGKTTLLRRFADVLNERDSGQRPVRFREEQYNVDRLSAFFRNVVNGLVLSLTADDVDAEDQFAAWVDEAEEILEDDEFDGSESEEQRRFSELLDRWNNETSESLVLLVDNFDLVVDGLGRTGEDLRSWVDARDWVTVVAATSTLAKFASDPGSPFSGWMSRLDLEPLNTDQLTDLLVRLANLDGREDVASLVTSRPGRVAAFRELTGGNVRTAVVLFYVFEADTDDSLESQLNELLDQHSALYKARFEELAAQGRKVADVLMSNWDPLTAAEIAKKSRLDTRIVSAQLARLRELGVVAESRPLPDTKRAGFEIAERFFNVWYLMRMSAGRRNKRRMLWLVRFLETLFGPEEVAARARRFEESGELPGFSKETAADFYAAAMDNSSTRLDADRVGSEADLSTADGRVGKAFRFFLKGEFEEAIAELTSIIGAPTSTPEQIARARHNRGVTYGRLGDSEREIADYTSVIEDPNSPAEQIAKARNNRGITYGQLGDSEREIADYTSVIEDPNSPAEQIAKAQNNLAFQIYMANNVIRQQDGVRLATSAYQTISDHANSHTVACLLAWNDDFDAALKLAGNFLPLPEPTEHVTLDDVIEFFANFDTTETATLAISWIDDRNLKASLRPIYEALRVIAAGDDEQILNRSAPEIRVAAKAILDKWAKRAKDRADAAKNASTT